MSGRGRRAHDRGSATVWAAVGVSVIMTVFVVGLHLGAAVIARHRAEAAADLAALAAAGLAVEGAEAACRKAGEVAAATGGTVTSCRLVGWDTLIEVHMPIAVTLPGIDGAAGRARAGPIPTTGASDPAPPVVGATPPNEPAASRPVGARSDGRPPSTRRAVGRRGQAGPPDGTWSSSRRSAPARRLGAPRQRSSSHRYRSATGTGNGRTRRAY